MWTKSAPKLHTLECSGRTDSGSSGCASCDSLKSSSPAFSCPGVFREMMSTSSWAGECKGREVRNQLDQLHRAWGIQTKLAA